MRACDGMDWKPPTAVAVWERYLVLAVVFGLAGTVLKALSVKAPAVMADPAFPAWLWIGGLDGGPAPWDSLDQGWTHVYDSALDAPPRQHVGRQLRRGRPLR